MRATRRPPVTTGCGLRSAKMHCGSGASWPSSHHAPWPASFPSGNETLSGKFIIFASPGQRGLERRELLNGLAFVILCAAGYLVVSGLVKEMTPIRAPTAGNRPGLASAEQQFLLARSARVHAVDSP